MKRINYLSLTLMAIILNIAMISTASSQLCKSKAYVSGWGESTPPYTACDSWMKATMEFDVEENTGEAEFEAYVQNTPYERVFNIMDYPETGHYSEVNIYYCSQLTNHFALISLATGPPGELEVGFTNPELTINYYASEPD